MPLKEDVISTVLQKKRIHLIAFVRTILKSYQASEDVYQEVSLYAIRNADKFEDTDHLLKWIWKTSRFIALSTARSNLRQPVLMDEQTLDLMQDFWLEQGEGNTDKLQFLEQCLAKLSEYGRKVIHLRYEKNLKGARLAQALGVKVGSAYVAVSRIHQTLSNCIKKMAREFDLS